MQLDYIIIFEKINSTKSLRTASGGTTKWRKKIRVGIIGCGGIANGKHLPGLQACEDVEMVAFCDLIEQRARDAAEKYGTKDAKVYTDYKELLKRRFYCSCTCFDTEPCT